MPRLELISVDERYCAGLLGELKQYASIPDGSRDAMLTRILRSAVMRVQEFADVPLAETKVRVTATVPEATGEVRLYMGGGTIESVTGPDGGPVGFDPLPGGRLLVYRRGITVSIVYTTHPSQAYQDRLAQVVLRYATADYDGAETTELNQILTEARL